MGLPVGFKVEWQQMKATIEEIRAMLADLSARISALEAPDPPKDGYGGGYR